MHEHSQTPGMTVQEAMKLRELQELYQRYMAETIDAPPVEEMPSMDAPGDDAGAHMVLRDNQAAGTLCGGPRNHKGHGELVITSVGGEHLECPCGTPVCPTCQSIAVAYLRYGRMP